MFWCARTFPLFRGEIKLFPLKSSQQLLCFWLERRENLTKLLCWTGMLVSKATQNKLTVTCGSKASKHGTRPSFPVAGWGQRVRYVSYVVVRSKERQLLSWPFLSQVTTPVTAFKFSGASLLVPSINNDAALVARRFHHCTAHDHATTTLASCCVLLY
jgi:hypothetical protein